MFLIHNLFNIMRKFIDNFSMEDKIAGNVGRMKLPLGKLRLNLLENQPKLKNTFTVEEYHAVKQS
ncbi:hypothetical protein [Bacillus altitudinis]|uniref:hypothetical protein n=1 Tax=Bacillus TaxID=1386 RepID=UPI00110E2DE3|nr:hypothetical protein [Bacillus altitudinis]